MAALGGKYGQKLLSPVSHLLVPLGVHMLIQWPFQLKYAMAERDNAQIRGLPLLHNFLITELDGLHASSQIMPDHRSAENLLFIRIELRHPNWKSGAPEPPRMADPGLNPPLSISPVPASC